MSKSGTMEHRTPLSKFVIDVFICVQVVNSLYFCFILGISQDVAFPLLSRSLTMEWLAYKKIMIRSLKGYSSRSVNHTKMRAACPTN